MRLTAAGVLGEAGGLRWRLPSLLLRRADVAAALVFVSVLLDAVFGDRVPALVPPGGVQVYVHKIGVNCERILRDFASLTGANPGGKDEGPEPADGGGTTLGRALGRSAWLATRLPYLAGSRRHRGQWISVAAEYTGRLSGAARSGCSTAGGPDRPRTAGGGARTAYRAMMAANSTGSLSSRPTRHSAAARISRSCCSRSSTPARNA